MKARLVSVLASLALTAAVLAVAAPAQAEPIPGMSLASPVGWRFVTNPDMLSLELYLYEDLPPGTVLDIAIAGCGGERVKLFAEDQFVKNNGRRLYPMTYTDGVAAGAGTLFGGMWEVDGYTGPQMGPDWTGVMSIARPGVEPWVWNFSNADFDFKYADPYVPLPTNNDTCGGASDGGGGSAITVQKWSAKKGARTAQVGKRLAVTPTRAAGAKVSYAWKVGAKVVDRDRAMTVKKSYRGKKVALRITVSKAGAKSVSKTLRYGTARS